MGKIMIRLVWFFRDFFSRQGVDMPQLIAIVETKLKMDERRVYMNWKQQQQKENRNQLRIILLTFLLYGIFIGAMMYFVDSLLLSMIVALGFVLFMMSMTLVTDFSSVLLDTTDNQIILPKPVSSKTFFMARLVHIVIYILQFSLALGIAPMIICFYKYGALTGIVFLIVFFLIVLSSVFFTYLLYLLLMRFVSMAKIREVITYFQIVMALIFLAGFQLLPRLVGAEIFKTEFTLHWYSFLLPPIWMAYTVDAINGFHFDFLHIIMILLAFGVPVLFFFVLIRYLAPSFSRKLGGMDAVASENVQTMAKPIRRPLSTYFSGWMTKNNIEKSSFEFTWKMTSRDKTFRLQFYPSLGYTVVISIIFLFRGSQGPFQLHLSQLAETSNYLWLIYLPVLTVAASLNLVGYNDQYQASWIYYSMPLSQPGYVLSGAAKALFVKYFLTIYTLLLAFALFVWGPMVIPDFVLGICNDALMYLVTAYVARHYLPFSRQPRVQQQSGKFIQVILQLLVIGVLVAIHFLVLHLPYVKYILMPISVAACWLLLTNLQQLAWNKIST